MSDPGSAAKRQQADRAAGLPTAALLADDEALALSGADWEAGVYRDQLVAALVGYPELQDRVRRLPAGGPYRTLQAVLNALPPSREHLATDTAAESPVEPAADAPDLTTEPVAGTADATETRTVAAAASAEASQSARSHETPALTEEEMDVLPDTHSDAVSGDEVAPALSEEDLDLHATPAEQREPGEPAPATDETAEDLGEPRAAASAVHGEGNDIRERNGIMSQDEEREGNEASRVRRVLSNLTDSLDDLEDRVEEIAATGVTASLGRVAGKERADRVVEQLDELEDRVEDTAERVQATVSGAAERAQSAAAGTVGRVEATAAQVSPIQRVLVLGVLAGIASGSIRSLVRRAFGVDLAWLGPKDVRPAVLGVGLAGAIASGFLPEPPAPERGQDESR